MGSYCEYFITAECPAHVEQDIIQFANSLDQFKSPPSFENWCWNKWTESTKWDEDRLMQSLSSQFPNIMFRVSCRGDYSYTSFWLAGSCLDENQIWLRPKFPTSKEFNDALVRVKKQGERRKAEQEQVQKEKELQQAKAKLASIELEKKELESRLNSYTKSV
jgi:hypothetical protein